MCAAEWDTRQWCQLVNVINFVLTNKSQIILSCLMFQLVIFITFSLFKKWSR
jgi:hypothetical protein